MAIGWALGRTPLFSEPAGQEGAYAAVLIKYVNYVAIPALLIWSLAGRELPSLSESKLVLGYYAAMYLAYAFVVMVLGRAFGQTLEQRAMYALVGCFANIGFTGLPLAQSFYGDEGVRLFLVIMSFHSLTLIPITLFLVEKSRAANTGVGALARVFAGMQTNPVLLALAVGLIWSALGVPFPDWLARILSFPAQSAAPVGLFVGGLALSRVKPEGDLKQVAAIVVVKLLLIPLMVWGMTRHVLGLPDLWVHIAVTVAALPAGLIPYMLAAKMNVAPRRAASAMLISAPLSAITLIILLLLIQNGLL